MRLPTFEAARTVLTVAKIDGRAPCATCLGEGVGEPGDKCAQCDATDGVLYEASDTAYHHEPGEPCRNKPVPLCRDCAEEHHAHWDEMWSEYRRACL